MNRNKSQDNHGRTSSTAIAFGSACTDQNYQSAKTATLGQGLPSNKKSGHHPREASGGAYTMFTPQQVKQFKEAFNMIDQDGDGRVTESDLKVMLSNLGTLVTVTSQLLCQHQEHCYLVIRVLTAKCAGQNPTPTLMHSLLSSRPGSSSPLSPESARQGINFTQFLAMMGEHLSELDPEHDVVEAFACFDDGDKGFVDVKEMRRYLGEIGDRMDDHEVSNLQCSKDFNPFTAILCGTVRGTLTSYTLLDRAVVYRSFHGSSRSVQLSGVRQGVEGERRGGS